MKKNLRRLAVIAISAVLLSGCANSGGEAGAGAKVSEKAAKETSGSGKMKDVMVITEEDLTAAGITSRGRWGDLVFNISYNIPYCDAPSKEAQIEIYPHGHSYLYYDNNTMYVEGLLDGEDYTLETLFHQIFEQKGNTKYKDFYQLADMSKGHFEERTPEHTERVKIGDIDAVYFDYKMPIKEGKTKEDQVTVFGYSFVYNEQPLCIYSHYKEKIENPFTYEAKTFDQVKQYAQYLIATMKPYEGEAFVELDKQGNFFRGFADEQYAYDDTDHTYGFHSKRWPFDSEARNVLFMAFKPWAVNGIFSGAGSGDYSTFYYPRRLVNEEEGKVTLTNEMMMKEDMALEDIYGAVAEKRFIPSAEPPEILDESDVTIYGIPMKRYVEHEEFNEGKGAYAVVYTFFIDRVPYCWVIELDASPEAVGKMSEACRTLYIQTTELIADTLIRTIRTSPSGEDLKMQVLHNAQDPAEYPFE